MAMHHLVPVVGDEWVQRRRQDAEGQFFRAVTDQGPSKGQGIYCLTASGSLLAFSQSHNTKNVRRILRGALQAFEALPSDQRRAEVPEHFARDPQWDAAPPPDAVILRAYARTLERDQAGAYRPCSKLPTTHGLQAARDHVWVRSDEWKSLIPGAPQPGELADFPASLVRRLCRFHLTDFTRGEPNMWRRDEIRQARLHARVLRVTEHEIDLTVEGNVLLATEPDVARSSRGFEARISGDIGIALPARLTRFDLVALGDHWGEGDWNKGARPGRAPLGFAFELVTGRALADVIPPHAARDTATYFSDR